MSQIADSTVFSRLLKSRIPLLGGSSVYTDQLWLVETPTTSKKTPKTMKMKCMSRVCLAVRLMCRIISCARANGNIDVIVLV